MRELDLKFYTTHLQDHYSEVIDFYIENNSQHVVFEEDEGLNEEVDYIGLVDKNTQEIIAMTSIQEENERIVNMWTTVVKKDERGKGYGRVLNEKMEELLMTMGYRKIASRIYTDNLPSIILKLKRGYIIEGTLRNHDAVGKHEYILGKEL